MELARVRLHGPKPRHDEHAAHDEHRGHDLIGMDPAAQEERADSAVTSSGTV
jgi:hypothetical protein